MGQLLFQYTFNPILETVHQFQYRATKTNEYGLYYQRYAALSDASIFDSPVAITKVATGVSHIQNLFPVYKAAHHATNLADLFVHNGEVSKAQKDTVELGIVSAQERYLKHINEIMQQNASRYIYTINYEDYGGSLIHNNDEYNIHLHDFLQHKYWFKRENVVSYSDLILISDNTWKHLSNLDSIFTTKERILREMPGYETTQLPEDWKNLNLSDYLVLDVPHNTLSIRNEISIWTQGPILNQYITNTAHRLDDDILNRQNVDTVHRVDNDHFNIYETDNVVRTESGYDIYSQEIAKLRFRTHLKMYENLFGLPQQRKLDLELYQRFGQVSYKKILTIENFLAKRNLQGFQILDNIQSKRDVYKVRWYENVHTQRSTYRVRWYENLQSERDVYRVKWYDNLHMLKGNMGFDGHNNLVVANIKDKNFNILSHGYHGSRNTYMNILWQDFCSDENNTYANVFKTVSAYFTQRYIEYPLYKITGRKTNPRGILGDSVNTATRSPYDIIANATLSAKRVLDDTQVMMFENLWGLKAINPIYELSLDNFVIRERKYICVIGELPVTTTDKIIWTSEVYQVCHRRKDVIESTTLWAYPSDKHTIRYQHLWANKSNSDIYIDDYFQLGIDNGKRGKPIWREDYILSALKENGEFGKPQDIFSYMSRKSLQMITEKYFTGEKERGSLIDSIKDVDICGYKDRLSIYLFPNVLAEKIKHDFLIQDTSSSIYKIRLDFSISDMATVIEKVKRDFAIYDTQNNVYKVKKDFSIDNIQNLAEKLKKDFIINDTSTLVYKEPKEIYFEFVHLWFGYKVPKDFIIMPWDVLADKVKKDFIINDSSSSVYKDRKSIPNADVIVSAIKDAFSIVVGSGFDHPSWEDVGGFIVSVSKVRKDAMTHEIDEMAKKVMKDSLVHEDDFASVIAEDMKSMLDNDLVHLDKYPHKVFMDYQNEGIVKSKVHGAIHNDYAIGSKLQYKGILEHGIWTSKSQKLLRSDMAQVSGGVKSIKEITIDTTDEWLAKGLKDMNVFENVFLGKQHFELDVFDQVSGSNKRINDANIFQEDWLEKLPNLCYYSYGTWMDKHQPYAVVEENTSVIKQDRKMTITFGDFAFRKNLKAWYDEYLVGGSIIRQGALADELTWMEKIRKKCGLHPNDFGNWTWVYETPDPFADVFGIDELLLPENDTHYENFKELIFDSEHMRPRKPVKELSDNQWIAKYPIKHPTQKWADVAVDYDASAIDWENYYGIETSIMHDIFLRYYRIWNVKMFEFSTMTMQQSVNLMLEYIWAWIPEYFPVTKLEQAYRVFKLIRWFGEAAIINNSQYIISYEYDNGGMKFKEDPKTHKKVWGIYGLETNLKDCSPYSSNDTMFMDCKQYVIRNNPVYVGRSDAWVEFIITAKRNTTLSFTLMNTVGSVKIYVDGVLTDTRSRTGKVIIPIQYTGDDITIRVEKDKKNNLNDQFMIGNLIIPEQDFKDLDIKFDPQLRAGNMPLNEIAQKMIAYAMLHDQRDKAWEESLKTNLGVSEVYKKMTKYWDDHHAGKIKGKRLTIKQV